LFGSVRFDHGLLDAVDGEGVGAVVEVAAGVGDVRASDEAQRVEGQVATARHGAGRGTGAQPAVVLVEGHVPAPMQTVFHGPVPSGVVVEVLRAGLVGVDADDAVDDFFAGADTVEAAGVAA
jgi:hypothetical protein